MDTVATLLAVARAILLIPPLAVAVLAFRRLLISRSGNAWVYAISGLLSFFVSVALLPFVVFSQSPDPFFVGLALTLPFLWIGIVLVCGPGQGGAYDPDLIPEDRSPLLLTDPLPPPMPVFRHRPTPKRRDLKSPEPAASVMTAAKRMRGNATSDSRRPKALPPPVPQLPFLRS